MNKAEFLNALRNGLEGIPESEIQKSLDFYGEMIDDRIEDNMTEEQAVASLDSIDTVVRQIINNTPLTALVKENAKPKRKMKAWEIVFLIVGSPIWLSILLAIGACVLAVYVCLWAVVGCVYAVSLALGAGLLVCLASCVTHFCYGMMIQGIHVLGYGLACGGLAILFFFGANQLARFMVFITKKITYLIKSKIIGGKKKNEES